MKYFAMMTLPDIGKLSNMIMYCSQDSNHNIKIGALPLRDFVGVDTGKDWAGRRVPWRYILGGIYD